MQVDKLSLKNNNKLLLILKVFKEIIINVVDYL